MKDTLIGGLKSDTIQTTSERELCGSRSQSPE